MNECELLELAAKAIGKNVIAHKFCNEFLDSWDGLIDYEDCFVSNPTEWNPMTSDGDCARMEAELGLNIEWNTHSVMSVNYSEVVNGREYFDDHGGDKQAARRMASLRVAAEIGRARGGA